MRYGKMELVCDALFVQRFLDQAAFAAADGDYHITLRRNYSRGNFVLSLQNHQEDYVFLGEANDDDWCNDVISAGIRLTEADQFLVEELQEFTKLALACQREGENSAQFYSFFDEYCTYKTPKAFFSEGFVTHKDHVALGVA